jgi:hypothetical protein
MQITYTATVEVHISDIISTYIDFIYTNVQSYTDDMSFGDVAYHFEMLATDVRRMSDKSPESTYVIPSVLRNTDAVTIFADFKLFDAEKLTSDVQFIDFVITLMNGETIRHRYNNVNPVACPQ